MTPIKISQRLASLSSFCLLLALWPSQITAQDTGCPLYPIALSAQSLVGVAPGTVLIDIFNGDQPGNFGWLSWAGSPSEPTLVTSLTAPGDSNTYINPFNPTDHVLSVGDWVHGKPGVSNSSAVRDALDELEGSDIFVPVWDQVQGTGDNAVYRVSGFARVHIIGYRLPARNKISAQFLGYDCSGGPV